MKNKVIYLLAVLLTLLVAIVSPYDFPVFLLAFELVFLVGLLLFSLFMSKKVKVSLQLPALTVSKQEPAEVEVKIENRSRLPIANVAVGLSYIDDFDGTTISERTSGMVNSKSTVVLRMKITARYAGKISFRLDQARIYDYLKLFKWFVPVRKETVQMLVVPDLYQVHLDVGNMTMRFREDGDSHSHERNGDDSSEVFDTRAFREGDTLQKIHWKLSAKTEELLVREFSMPVENTVILLADLYLPKNREWTHMQMDGMLTVIASISYSLLVQECPHEIVWYAADREELNRLSVTSEEDIYELAGQLIDAGVYEKQIDLEQIYTESYSLGTGSRVLVVDTGWNLSMEGERVASLSNKEIDKVLPELLIGI